MIYFIFTILTIVGTVYPFAMSLLNEKNTLALESQHRTKALKDSQNLANLLNEIAHTNRSLLQLYCDELALRTQVLVTMGQEALTWPIDKPLDANTLSSATQKAAQGTQALLALYKQKSKYLVSKNYGLAKDPLLGALGRYVEEVGPAGVSQWIFDQKACLPKAPTPGLETPLLGIHNKKSGLLLKNHPSFGGVFGAAMGAISLQRLLVPLATRVLNPPLVTTPLFMGRVEETGVLLFSPAPSNGLIKNALTRSHGTNWATILTHPLLGWDGGRGVPEPYLAFSHWHKPRHQMGWRYALLYPHFAPTVAHPKNRIGGPDDTTIF